MEGGITLFLVVAGLALVFRLAAGSMDKDRVDTYIRQRGGQLLSKHWAPFGRGWFGEKNARIYEIVYRDREGNTREATIKTSMFSGVYMTEDRIVRRAEAKQDRPAPATDNSADRLAAENEQLRRRITELERGGR